MKQVYIGIDVSKNTFDACFTTKESFNNPKERNAYKYQTYNNSKVDILRFIQRLNGKLLYSIRKKEEGLMEWVVTFENTGRYHKLLMKYLWDAGIKMSMINSHKAKNFHKIINPNRKQDDKTDSWELLQYGMIHKPELSKWDEFNEDLILQRSIWRINKKNCQRIKQNEHNIKYFMSLKEKKDSLVLWDIIKRIRKYSKQGQNERALEKFKQTITYFTFDNKKQEDLLKIAKKDVIKAVNKGIENNTMMEYYRIVSDYEVMKKTQQNNLINILTKKYPKKVACIMSIPCVGETILIETLITTAGFTKFIDDNGKYKRNKYTSYIGLGMFGKDSGTSVKGKKHLNNFSDKTLRILLRTVVVGNRKSNEEVNAIYDKVLAETKTKKNPDGNKQKAANVAARKLAKQIWYCGVNEKMYKPASERI